MNTLRGYGSFYRSVVEAGLPGGSKRAASEFGSAKSGPDGGFAVPMALAKAIFNTHTEGALLPHCQVIPTASAGLGVPSDESTPWGSSGIIAVWDNEGDTATQRKPELSLQDFKLRRLRVLVPVTDELLADSDALDTWLPGALQRAVTWKTNEAIVAGTGAGIPLGILNAGSTLTVDKAGGQAADTITDANIGTMLARALDPTACGWICNPGAYGALTALSAFDGATRTLAGLPILLTDACKELGTRGDLILGDLSGYRIVARSPEFATSMHMWFDQSVTAFRLTFRMDGQPILAAPVTPPNSAITRSHFVVLADRA